VFRISQAEAPKEEQTEARTESSDESVTTPLGPVSTFAEQNRNCVGETLGIPILPAVASDGSVAVAYGGNRLRLSSPDCSGDYRELTLPQKSSSIAFSPDAKTLYIGATDGTITPMANDTLGLGEAVPADSDEVTALVTAPDGTIYSGSFDGTIRRWTPTLESIGWGDRDEVEDEFSVIRLAIGGDGDRMTVLVFDASREVKFLDIAEGAIRGNVWRLSALKGGGVRADR
jgi:WD40 repeat protein